MYPGEGQPSAPPDHSIAVGVPIGQPLEIAYPQPQSSVPVVLAVPSGPHIPHPADEHEDYSDCASWSYLFGFTIVPQAFNTADLLPKSVPAGPDGCMYPMIKIGRFLDRLYCFSFCVGFFFLAIIVAIFGANFFGGLLILMFIEAPVGFVYWIGLTGDYLYSVLASKRLGFVMTVFWVALTPLVMGKVALKFLGVRLIQTLAASVGVLRPGGDYPLIPLNSFHESLLYFAHTRKAISFIFNTSMPTFRSSDGEHVEIWLLRLVLTVFVSFGLALISMFFGVICVFIFLIPAYLTNTWRIGVTYIRESNNNSQHDICLACISCFVLLFAMALSVFLGFFVTIVFGFLCIGVVGFANLWEAFNQINTYRAFHNHHIDNLDNWLPRFDLLLDAFQDRLNDGWVIGRSQLSLGVEAPVEYKTNRFGKSFARAKSVKAIRQGGMRGARGPAQGVAQEGMPEGAQRVPL